MIRIARSAVLSVSLLVGLGWAPDTVGGEANQAILVLDASGSMWGRIGDEPKIAIARGVVGDLLGDWDDSIELGVMAYGHRRKGDCDDIETLVPVGKVDRARIRSAVGGLNPKGKTPISAAVRRAAEQLRYTETKATVILVSDGKETCNADPCALSAELEKLGVDFTAHVIAFDLGGEEARTLQCIADHTGGKFLRADSAADLTKALQTAVAEVAKPAPKPRPTVKPGLDVSAILSAGAEPFGERVVYNVYPAAPAPDGARERIDYAIDPTASFDLPPGRYVVTAAFANAEASATLEVEPSQRTEHVFVLDAGVLAVSGVRTAGVPLNDPISYQVYPADSSLAEHERVTYAIDPTASFHLAAGTYAVTASYHTATTRETVTIRANQRTEKVLDLNCGSLRIEGRKGDQPIRGHASYQVYPASSSGAEHERVTYGIDSSVTFHLAAGRYRVTGALDGSGAEAIVTIEAGKHSTLTLDF